jgi:hypothetical protein
MKTIAYTALHYGRDYLAYAIRSIIDYVDEYHVLYSAVGSHGTRTNVPCPESRGELAAIALKAAGHKLRWHDGEWPHEGAQRDSIYEYVPDADVILVLDADEIWDAELVRMVLDGASIQSVRELRVPMIHYWRSFYRAITDDVSFPTRVICPRLNNKSLGEFEGHYESGLPLVINHMGYAQRSEIVEYKQLTHGHRGEWRPEWYDQRFAVNAQEDCHPVNKDYWYPRGVNPLDYMPMWMSEHPYFRMKVIP